MPVRVDRVRWICPRCAVVLDLLPSVAKLKRFCSRACHHADKRSTAREKVKREYSYGERRCAVCDVTFIARHTQQKVCSQACSVRRAQQARRNSIQPGARACEHCRAVFTPRQKDMAGRFCSWKCKVDGQKGERAGSWRGGRHVTADGYVRVLVSPGKYELEHRFVMKKILGRELTKHETVHHVDGDRGNNHPTNLQLRIGRHGKGALMMCANCGSRDIVAAPLPTGQDFVNAQARHLVDRCRC